MSDEQFVYLGNIPPKFPVSPLVVREDKRTVTVRQSGLDSLLIGDASTLGLVDQKGKGILEASRL